jgi:hypothetical protein
MMLGAGALVLLIRKESDWGEWGKFFALAIPAAILFAVALVGRARMELRGWQTAFLVFGTLLLLVSLLQLVQALKGTPSDELNLVWTFGVTAGVAIFTSFALRAPFQMLLGALLLIVSYLALWDKILTDPSGDTVRWLLLVLAAIYLAVAVSLARAGKPQASDLITVAGVVAVIAAGLSFAAAANTFTDAAGSLGSDAPQPGQGWNVFLLIVSLLLIGYGSRAPTRGPGYVGAAGLLSFIFLTGADLVSRLNGDEGGGVVGWPLILLIGGAAALVLSFVLAEGSLGGGGGGAALGPQAGGPGYGGPGLPGQQPPAGQPGAAPEAQPPAGGQPGQPGSLLDQWRQQPPPGGGPPQQ